MTHLQGSKRVKLGLKTLVDVSHLSQEVNVESKDAVNLYILLNLNKAVCGIACPYLLPASCICSYG